MTASQPTATQELDAAIGYIERAQETCGPDVPVAASLILAHEAIERALHVIQTARCEAAFQLDKL